MLRKKNSFKYTNETSSTVSLNLVHFYLIWYGSRVQSGTVCKTEVASLIIVSLTYQSNSSYGNSGSTCVKDNTWKIQMLPDIFSQHLGMSYKVFKKTVNCAISDTN